MNKRILITIGIIIITIVLLVGCIQQEKPWECKTDEDCKNVRCVGAFCDNGICKCPPGKPNLSQVNVASLYERVTDGIYYEPSYRSVDDLINLLNETKTDFIFRGFWRWSPPCPDSTETASPVLIKYGYSYQQLEEVLAQIKKEMPEVIFCGAIPAQRVNLVERNPITGKIYKEKETGNMALDPAKWRITTVSKEQLQDYMRERGVGEGGYFPDITNPEFQELLLSWAKKQIDSGADAIWIDGLFGQARIFKGITKDENHPAVKESYEAASEIVDKIHGYGYSQGRYIYVGTWWAFVELPYPPPDLDFVTVTPSPDEVSSMHLNESKWDSVAEEIKGKRGNVPIFAFIDWAGTTKTPLGRFSQKLTPEEQREFLKLADGFFQRKAINFVYPLHGGFMGQEATILSFNRSKTYDSLAPEFQTYATIKELARNKT